jgi:hypothetical protein
MSSRNPIRRLLFSLIVPVVSAQSLCADVLDDLEVHGFATQGFVKTSANSFFGDSENGSFEFTELGVNATLEPSAGVRLSGQLLSRRAGEMYSGSPSVDFALADFSIRNTQTDSLSVLIGRIKNPLGLFNETRDVAFTRPGIFLPQVVYFDKLRNVILSSDGVGVRMEHFGDRANVNLYLAAGQPQTDENIEYVYLGRGYSGGFEPTGLSYIGRLLVETPDNRLRASLSVASTSLDFDRKPTDSIGNGDVDVVYWIASLQYATENWTFTSEYMREPIEWRGFAGSMFDGMSAKAEGYYLQAAWRAREDIELMFRYEEGFADRADRSGRQMQRATGGLVPAHSRYSKIFTVGARWDLSSNFMLRAEYQRHNGTFVLSSRENPIPSDMDPDWDMFSISASYRF